MIDVPVWVAFAMAVQLEQASIVIDLHNITPTRPPIPYSAVGNSIIKLANQLEQSFVVAVASAALVASHIAVDFADFGWHNWSYQR